MDEALRVRYIFEIRKLAQQQRTKLQLGAGAIGENLFKITRDSRIKLVYYPVALHGVGTEFLAAYLRLQEPKKELSFIALNTAQSYDHQLFSLAHQLYHHWTHEHMCVCYSQSERTELVEFKANRFATELLLPTAALLKEIGARNDDKKNLFNYTHTALLRFVALLHCDYKLPYRAIIRKLIEDALITAQQFERLNIEDERSPLGTYYQLASHHEPATFERLNQATYVIGADGEMLHTMLRHLEKQHVTAQELTEDLRLFEKPFHLVQGENERLEDEEAYFSTS